MTNNFDDFEHQEDLEQGLAPPKTRTETFKDNLTEAWRTKPLFKLMVLMVVVGAAVAASVSFFSSGPADSPASLLTPPEVTGAAPGGKATPYVRQQTEMANKQRSEDAMKSGGSAIPTPIGANTETDVLATIAKNDPLNELRAEIERLKEAKQPQQVQQTQQPEPFDNTLAQAMQAQLKQVMESWTPQGIKQVTVSKAEEKPAGNATGNSAATAHPRKKALIPAGTVNYAQMLTEANSDVPGPILAQIVSGPLTGARLVGQFQVANGVADYLVLQFKLASLKGKEYKVDAIALDPDTTLGGMATEVDQRYFTRILLPAAAGFLQGFASALGESDTSVSQTSNSTVIQQSGKSVSQGLFQGLGQAAQTAGQFFSQQASKTRPLVRVAAGTPMGIFFVSSVYDNDGTVQEVQDQDKTAAAAKTQDNNAQNQIYQVPTPTSYGNAQQMYNQGSYTQPGMAGYNGNNMRYYPNMSGGNTGYPSTYYMGGANSGAMQ